MGREELEREKGCEGEREVVGGGFRDAMIGCRGLRATGALEKTEAGL
jgi:hypothetical protein